MKKICVFCGSNTGNDTIYTSQAQKLAVEMANRRMDLVYGGGSIGLMGVIADKLLDLGGEVTGVIPEFLAAKEVDHKNLTQMITVASMHDRKKKLSEISDAFIAMPGGLGTLEEIAEILTWAQLGLVQKPIGILNVNGYYDHLIDMLDYMVETAFLKPENHSILQVSSDPALLLQKMGEYIPVMSQKWLDETQT